MRLVIRKTGAASMRLQNGVRPFCGGDFAGGVRRDQRFAGTRDQFAVEGTNRRMFNFRAQGLRALVRQG